MKKILFIVTLLMASAVSYAQIKPIQTQQPTKQGNTPPKNNVVRTGTLSIGSTPADCVVKIGGEDAGRTPLTLTKSAGKYTITFEKEGYETQTKSVNVVAGKTVKCEATLKEKKLTPKDSLLMLADEFIARTPFLPDESTLNEEGKGILAFQKNAIKYATHLRDVYTNSVGAKLADGMTDEAIGSLLQRRLLQILQTQTLEKSCLNDALALINNINDKESLAKIGFNKEPLVKIMASGNQSPISDAKGTLIKELTGERKFVEAIGTVDDALLEGRVLERYNNFLVFLKNFYNVGNLRLDELKTNKGE